MSIEQVVNAVEIAANKLPHMDIHYRQVKEEVDNMQRTRHYLSNNIQALKNKISILDATAFSCEQGCRKKNNNYKNLLLKRIN